ncbi:MAG: hypothetical protein HUK09_05605 [Bacteroidaceae bacterium]|nr:hypothetical protein [Bacteroidaceae bacterium]
MKRISTFLLTCAMMWAGGNEAWARYWTYDAASQVTANGIQANTPYALQTGFAASTGTPWFLAGDRFLKTQNLNDTQIFKFVPVEGVVDAQGSQVYYMQRNATGDYLAAPSNGQFYTTQTDRAWKLVVKDAHYENLSTYRYEWSYTNENNNDTIVNLTGIDAWLQQYRDMQDPEGAMLNQLSSNPQAESGAVVIVSYEPNTADDKFSQYSFFLTYGQDSPGGAAGKGVDYARNAWVIYPAYTQAAMESLNAIVQEVLGTAASIPEKLQNYTRGTGAGEYSPELYASLEDTWNKITQVQAGTLNLTDDEIDALSAKLTSDYQAFVTSGKPLSEGYYIVYSLRPNTQLFPNKPGEYPYGSNETNYDSGALYDGAAVTGTDKNLRWTLKKDDAVNFDIDTFNEDRTKWEYGKFVWKVTKSDKVDEDGNPLFYFQNLITQNFISKDPKTYSPVVMSQTPDVAYTISTSAEFPGYFNFYSPALTVMTETGAPTPAKYSGLHTERGNTNVVAWDYRIGGSCWKVLTVSQDEVDALLRNYAQPQRNKALNDLIATAEAAIENGKSYAGFDAVGNKIAKTTTPEMGEVDGLITTADQLNCPMTELSANEGGDVSVGQLLDNNFGTYFHSAWSGGEPMWKGGHYLQMTLPAAEQKLLVRWSKRVTNAGLNNGGAPLQVVFWGTNDEAALAHNKAEETNAEGESVMNYDAWKKQGWDSVAVATFKYPHTLTVGTRNLANGVGAAYFESPTAYKYYRMEVKTRVQDGDRPNGNKYFHGSELRVYKGGYDPTTSFLASVPADIVAKLQQQIAAAKPEAAAEQATQPTIDALSAALKEFLRNYPDPSLLQAAITEAKAVIAAAAEGTDLGYYAAGTKDVYAAAVAEVEAGLTAASNGKQPTAAEIFALTAKLDAATETFNAALRMPADGYYKIVSRSNNAQNTDRKMYAKNSSRGNDWVMMGGRQQVKGSNPASYEDTPGFNGNLGQFWQVTKQDTGFVMRNVLNGLYLAPVAKEEKVSLSETPYIIPIRFAKEPGCFNLLIAKDKAKDGTYVYMNAQPASSKVVTWNAASGRDNSAFQFVPVSATEINSLLTGGFTYELASPNKPQIITFPIDVNAEGGFYSVIGQNPNDLTIQLKAETTTLKAGQAYVYIPATTSTSNTVLLGSSVQNVSELKPTWTALPAVNGLQGVFEHEVMPEASGRFNNDRTRVLLTEKGEKVSANTGYFTQMPSTTTKGDAELQVNGIITGIESLIAAPGAAKQGIYTLQGIRVSSTKALPAGVYIVDGKKVVVQ